MRIALFVAIFSLSTLLSSAAQAPASASPQALQLLQSALAALSPNIKTQDVTLSGSAHYIAGSDDETGTATLKAIATGASRVDLSLSSGSRSEVRNLSGNPPAGTWSGPDGVSHRIAYHNLLNEPTWFAPVATVSRLVASPTSIATYIGAETLDVQQVQHISVAQQPPALSLAADIFPHLTQVDLYLDSSTFLPAAISFKIHPDNNELIDIPIEVRFSDYRAVNGTQVPFHVQKFLNNGLILDFQADSVTLNSGLAASSLVSPSGL
jgi:hypothetical protein